LTESDHLASGSARRAVEPGRLSGRYHGYNVTWNRFNRENLMSEDAIGILVLPTAALIGVLSGFIAR
jgi:hypothetical protein